MGDGVRYFVFKIKVFFLYLRSFLVISMFVKGFLGKWVIGESLGLEIGIEWIRLFIERVSREIRKLFG